VEYQLIYEESVIKEDFTNLDAPNRQRIMKEIGKKLSIAPNQFGRPLSGKLKGFRRLRVGDYRVIYKVDNKNNAVSVIMVIHRSSKYKGVEQRILKS